MTQWLSFFSLSMLLLVPGAQAQLTWSLAGGNESWPGWARDAITKSMTEAADLHNRYGYFQKHLTANYNTGVPTAQAGYDGWIDFGTQYNTRTALHEMAHALGTGTYWPFNGGPWGVDSAAGRLIKLYEGQAAVLSTGGSHFWPYGLNYDSEDGPAARERHCKLVAAFRFDMGIVVDSDKDGMPDDWETHHFDGLAQAASGDVDGDGISNIDEYATDSDPKVSSPVSDGHTYTIRSQLSRRAVTVAGASRDEAAEIEQRTADGEDWQSWRAEYVNKGYFRFTNVNSGKVLEVPGSNTASGRPLRQAAWTGSLQQQWRIVGGPGAKAEHWQLANRETARVVDGLDGAEGAPIQQWPFLGNLAQQFWTFEEVEQEEEDTADAGMGPGSAADAGSSDGDDEASDRDDEETSGDGDAGASQQGGTGGLLQSTSDGGCAVTSGRETASVLTKLLALAMALLALRRRARRHRRSS
jgi:hypothetical protein